MSHKLGRKLVSFHNLQNDWSYATDERFRLHMPLLRRETYQDLQVAGPISNTLKENPLRKIIASPFVTLDGFIAGPDGTLDWSVGDEAIDREQLPALLSRVDAILLGRLTYQALAAYWPFASGEDDPAEAVAKLKQQQGRDIVIFGSGRLVSQLAQAGLIAEYQLRVNPVVLGSGKRLFQDLKERVKLKLLDIRTSPSGVVVLHYQLDTK